MKSRKNIIAFVISIIILIVVFVWLDTSNLKLLLNVKFVNLVVSLIFALLTYVTSGIQYYFVRKQFGVSLKAIDIVLLPIVGNLWSFVFPFQGNLLFTTMFFKKKYNMNVSESFSISIYLYFITLSFTGLIALAFAFYNNMFFSWLGIFSLLFLLNPFFIYIANLLFNSIGESKFKLIRKTQVFITSVVENTNDLWKNIKFTMIVFILNAFRILLSIIWFYWISYSLGFDLSFLAVGLISLIMSVSIIIKFTPDNLGVAQLVTGAFMGLVGASPDQAVLITLFSSATTIILIFTIGLAGNFYYFRTINFLKVK